MTRLHDAFYGLLGFLALVPVLVALAPYLGRWEGRIAPVASPIEWARVEPQEGGASLVWVRFEKLRPCAFAGLDFYAPEAQGQRRIPVAFEPDATGQSRPTGGNIAGPWRITHPDPRALIIRLTSHCHPLWPTITRMQP